MEVSIFVLDVYFLYGSELFFNYQSALLRPSPRGWDCRRQWRRNLQVSSIAPALMLIKLFPLHLPRTLFAQWLSCRDPGCYITPAGMAELFRILFSAIFCPGGIALITKRFVRVEFVH